MAKQQPGTCGGWVTIDRAAAFLGTTAAALRKAFDRRAKKVNGGVEAHLDGVRARKFGRCWRVKFSAAWLESGAEL